jgi:hypothetical protein
MGKKTPVFAHMGMTDMFDRTDPPLEKLFAKAAKGRKTAIVWQVLPRFFIDADKSGAMQGILMQGGWFYSGDVWSPFLLTQAGPDDVVAQRGILKPGAPSRGLLRERAQDPDILKSVHAFQASLVSRVSGVSGLSANKSEDGSHRVATGPTGWSFFGNDQAFEMHEALMGSLRVPTGPTKGQESYAQPVEDIDEAASRAPAGLLEAVSRIAETEEESLMLLRHLVVLTNSFEGLDDASCEGITSDELHDIIKCSTATFSAGELAYWLHEGMGWEFEWVSVTDPDEQESNGEEGDGPDLVRHGDIFAVLKGADGAEPVPVMFHGGRIDPDEAASDFAFMATRLSAVRRSGGKPILVMPATINMRVPEGEATIEEGGGVDRLVMMAGYAFDGEDWTPVSFGQPGSDPMMNKLAGGGQLPDGESVYTGMVSLPHVDEGGVSEHPALSLVLLMQQALDRYHDLGPDVDVPRHFEDVEASYGMVTKDGTWCWLQDKMQDEIYDQN